MDEDRRRGADASGPRESLAEHGRRRRPEAGVDVKRATPGFPVFYDHLDDIVGVVRIHRMFEVPYSRRSETSVTAPYV
ncbi:MAG: hypothetical protein R2706_20020 [Acidimicrobiales bacterium]